jgi:hypothetical protein
MWGEIIKIDKIKKSKNPEDRFIRVYFKLANQKFAKMDLVPSFRNFARWKQFLRVGTFIDELRFKDEETVDADSFPVYRTEMNVSLQDDKFYKLSKNCL